MILVTVGSSGFPFDRLLRQVDRIELNDEIVVQHGPSQVRPRNARCVPFLRFAELESAVRSARLVITHAGVGSVLVALMNQKKPVVVPRLAQYGEVVDDHQLHFGERLARDGVVTLLLDPTGLPRVVETGDAVAEGHAGRDNALESDLRAYLQSVLQRPAAG